VTAWGGWILVECGGFEGARSGAVGFAAEVPVGHEWLTGDTVPRHLRGLKGGQLTVLSRMTEADASTAAPEGARGATNTTPRY